MTELVDIGKELAHLVSHWDPPKVEQGCFPGRVIVTWACPCCAGGYSYARNAKPGEPGYDADAVARLVADGEW